MLSTAKKLDRESSLVRGGAIHLTVKVGGSGTGRVCGPEVPLDVLEWKHVWFVSLVWPFRLGVSDQ